MVTSKAFSFPQSSFIGFDHIWSEIERLSAMSEKKLYPPHNVIKHSDESYSIELALAGYSREELSLEVKPGILIISASPNAENAQMEYLHKGISSKAFTRTFRLSEHVVVDGADFVDGLLVVGLKVVVPEEKRPRIIPIGQQDKTLLTED